MLNVNYAYKLLLQVLNISFHYDENFNLFLDPLFQPFPLSQGCFDQSLALDGII